VIYYKGLECDVWPEFVFHDVLAAFQAFQRTGAPIKRVVDIGAHHGSLSLLAAHYGAEHVTAVEPFHKTELAGNIERCGFEGVIHPIFSAVSTRERIEIISAAGDGAQGFLYKDKDALAPEIALESPWLGKIVVDTIFVDCVSLESLLGDDVDLLKIDTEGGEYNFLPPTDETKALLRRARFIDLEVHQIWDSRSSWFDLESDLIHPEYRCRDGAKRLEAFVESCGYRPVKGADKFGFGPGHPLLEREDG
jgi:FkbM family methyltransferase